MLDVFDLSTITYWHWWIGGILLLVIEVVTTTTFFLWFGVSALVIGMLNYIFPALSLPVLMIVWAVLSIVGVILWNRHLARNKSIGDGEELVERHRRIIGQVLILSEPIENGFGRAYHNGILWTVRGSDLGKGKRVIVEDVDGAHLVVRSDNRERS